MNRAWCPDCQTMRDVTDAFVDDSGDSRVRIEVTSVTVLSCEHTIEVVTDGGRSPLQQVGPTPAMLARDPFDQER